MSKESTISEEEKACWEQRKQAAWYEAEYWKAKAEKEGRRFYP